MTTITGLPAASAVASSDVMPIEQGGITRKAYISQALIAMGDAMLLGAALNVSTKIIPTPVNIIRTSGYTTGGDGGAAFYKKALSAPTHPGRLQSADGAWWEIVPEKGVIDPKQLGATANGTADDSATLVAAEAVAYALGVALFFGPYVYTYNGNWTCRVSIYSVNGTIKQISPTPGNSGGIIGNNTLEITSGSGLVIDGLTVNSPTFRGMLIGNVTDLVVNNVHVVNAAKQGMAFTGCSNVTVTSCTAKHTTHPTATYPMVGGDADGFYTQASSSITFIDCYAYDFARIGFVCEAAATGSKDITFIRCTAEYARNCDESTTEYNAGFWEENAENITYIKCVAKNIDSGVGQTNGHVRGYVLAGLSSIPTSNKTTLIECAIYCTGTMVYGLTASGVGPQNTLHIEKFLCSGSNSGMSLYGTFDSIVLKDFTLENAIGASGHMITAQSVTATNILLDDIRVLNAAWVATDGDLIFFSTPPGSSCNLSIINTTAPFLVNLSSTLINSIFINNCRVSYSSGIHATEVKITNSILTPLLDGIALIGGAGITGARVTISNSTIYSAGAAKIINIIGANITAVFDNVVFDGITVLPQLTGSSNTTYDNCLFLRYGPTRTFALTGNADTATRYEMVVKGCKFVGDAVAHTPMNYNTFGLPTYTVVLNNTYNTTLLIDATWSAAAGATVSNNVQTL